jgi:hypothetical protein
MLFEGARFPLPGTEGLLRDRSDSYQAYDTVPQDRTPMAHSDPGHSPKMAGTRPLSARVRPPMPVDPTARPEHA